MLNSSEIGQRIALLRREKGYTQEALATLLHVTGQAVSKWENGNAIPDTTLLPVLAEVMETSIDRLLTGNDFTKMLSPYDRQYDKLAYYWGLNPSLLAEKVASIIQHDLTKESNLLDLGSGEGRDAIYFAKCGFVVDAIEISQPGIKKIEQFSQVTGVSVNAIHANMIGYEFTRDYKVIYSMGALQFLPPEERQKHFATYKGHTCVGGVNAHLVFVEKPFIAVAPDWEKNEFFYRSGDLASYYHDWEIIQCGEAIFACDSSNIVHRHAVSFIIAKKPG